MLDTDLSSLTGDQLFQNLLGNFTGQGPFPDDPFVRQTERASEAFTHVRGLPRISTHRHLIEEHDAAINRLLGFEESARRELKRAKNRMEEALVARQRRHDNLEEELQQLAAEEEYIRGLDAEYLRLLPQVFKLCRRQEPIGIVPLLAPFAVGRQAELKGGNGRSRLTIRTREDADGQRTFSATSDPTLLAEHWVPTELPSQFTRQGSLPGRPKPKRRRPGVVPIKQRAIRPLPWQKELDLYSEFPGIVPDEVRDRLPYWDKQFNGDIFILVEAKWKTHDTRFICAGKEDPIVFGRWKNRDGVPYYWVLKPFNLTDDELRAMEHTEKIVYGEAH